MSEQLCNVCGGSLSGFGADVSARLCFSCLERRKKEPSFRDTAPSFTASRGFDAEDPRRGTASRGREKFADWFWPLHARYLAGEATPADVPLPFDRMPTTASPLMWRIAQHMQVCMGLMLAEDETKPLPYAYSMAERFCGARNADAAGRAIDRLVKAGVVERGPDMPRRKGMRHATRTYRAPDANVVQLREAA